MEEWSVIHLASGELVKDGFPSERAAYRWLERAATAGDLEPSDLNEYSVEKAEEE